MNIAAIILALFITAFIYLVFPITYVNVKGKVGVKKGRKMALINSIVGAIFSYYFNSDCIE